VTLAYIGLGVFIEPWQVTLERIGAATLCGAVLGLDRNIHGKPAGLRTHALVALGAAAFVDGSLQLTAGDPSGALRTVQGIVTGIGFLGAGVILHPAGRNGTKGLTTAAVVWVAAATGTACGAGLYLLGSVTTLAVLVVVRVGGWMEHRIDRMIWREANGRQEADGAGAEKRSQGAEKAADAAKV